MPMKEKAMVFAFIDERVQQERKEQQKAESNQNAVKRKSMASKSRR